MQHSKSGRNSAGILGRSAFLPDSLPRAVMICFMFFMSLVPVFASGVEFSFIGVRLNGSIISGIPLPVGVDAEIRVPVAGKLLFTFRLAGGYEDRYILRDNTGLPVMKPAVKDGLNWFEWPNLESDAGLVYRLSDKASDGSGRRMEVFALGRFRWEGSQSSLSTDIFKDANGLVAFSAIAGLGANNVRVDETRMRSGYSGEVSLEYAPPVFAILGGTDFFRANIKTTGYQPLVSLGDASRPLARSSVYAAWMATADWVSGKNLPHYALTGFGGRELRGGIGRSVRGYQNWGYESPLKAAMSAEVRAVGPAIFGVASLRPMAYIFGDSGFFSGLYKAGTLEQQGGIVFSSGAGLNLGLLDFAYLGARAGYRFPVTDPLGSYYYDSGSRFFWDITFLLHF